MQNKNCGSCCLALYLTYFRQALKIILSKCLCFKNLSVALLNNKLERWSWAQCYKTLYRGLLPPFHGNTIILCYKAILPW
jgi:hypothetical protein